MNATRSTILLAMTLLIPAVHGQAADPARPAQPTKPAQVYVPYRDLAELVEPSAGAVLMNRAEFDKLIAAARTAGLGDAPPADAVAAQISDARLHAKVAGSHVSLTGVLSITCIGDRPTLLHLAFGQIGLTKMTLNGKPAPLGYDPAGRLMLIVPGRGEHKLEIEAAAAVRELPTGGSQFAMNIPAAVAGVLLVSAPGDLEIHSNAPIAADATRYDKQVDRTDAEIAIGGVSSLSVLLLGNGRQEGSRAVLLGESVTRLTLGPASQELSCLFTVQVLRRQVRELRFAMPADWVVTDVACDNLSRWSIEKQADNAVLAVQLSAAVQGSQVLYVQASAKMASTTTWQSPSLRLLDADFQRGYLVVDTGPRLRIRGRKVNNARQVAPAAGGASQVVRLFGGLTGEWFHHWSDAWSVQLELAGVELRRSSDDVQIVSVDTGQVALEAQFRVAAIGQPMFDVGFIVPGAGWDVVAVSVDGRPDGFRYNLTPVPEGGASDGGRILRVDLPSPVRAEGEVKIGIAMRHVPTGWKWSDTPSVVDSEKDSRTLRVPLIRPQVDTFGGVVGVVSTNLLELTDERADAPLSPVNVGRMAGLGLGSAVRFAFTYNADPTGTVSMHASRPQTSIFAEAIGLVSLRPSGMTGDWTMNYIVTGRPVDRLHVLVDRLLGEAVRIDAVGRRIVSRKHSPCASQPDGSPEGLSSTFGGLLYTRGEGVSASQPAEREPVSAYDLWELTLDSPVLGLVRLNVHYDRPAVAAAAAVPLVRPAKVDQSGELLAVQADEELAIRTTAENAVEIDALELPDNLPMPAPVRRLLSVWRLAPQSEGKHSRIVLEASSQQRYAIPAAVVSLAELVTHVGPPAAARQMTEATYYVVNGGLQFLRIKLPAGAALWSIRVGENPARPGRDTEGHYLVNVPRSSQGSMVRVLYVIPPVEGGTGVKLAAPTLPDVQINRVTWKVVPPAGYEIAPGQTSLRPVNQPRPTPAVMDVLQVLAVGPFRTAGLSKYRACRAPEETTYTDAPAAESLDRSDSPDYARAPAASQPEDAFEDIGRRVIAKGRYALPVDLPSEAGAGPAVQFEGLSTVDLDLTLAPQSRKRAWWGIGFLLATLAGLGLMRARAGKKFAFVLILLVASTLAAFAWPTVVWPANGAFFAGLAVTVLYILIGWIRFMRRTAGTIGRMPTAPAVLVALTVFAAAGTALAQQPSGRTPAQTIVIPYDGEAVNLPADENAKVLVPLARYTELVNRTRPDAAARLVISDVRYEAALDVTAQPARLNVVLKANVKATGSPTTGPDGGGRFLLLPLPMENMAVVSATIDGAPLRLKSHPHQTTLGKGKQVQAVTLVDAALVPIGSAGQLVINAVTTPQPAGGLSPADATGPGDWQRGSVRIGMPPLPGATLALRLPVAQLVGENGQDLGVQVDGVEQSAIVRSADQWLVPLGLLSPTPAGTLGVRLNWSPRRAVAARAGGSLSAHVDHQVYAFQWALVGVSRLAYTLAATEHDSFLVLVPSEATVVGIDGPNVRGSEDEGELEFDKQKFHALRVRLHKAASTGNMDLSIRWVAALPEKESVLPLVRAGQVARESGGVTLYAANGLDVQVTSISGGRRSQFTVARVPVAGTDAPKSKSGEEKPQSMSLGDSSHMVGQFVWPYRPFSMSVRISRQAATGLPERAQLSQLVRITSDRVQLLATAKLSLPGGKLFAAALELPDGYDVLSVTGANIGDWYIQPATAGRKRQLHVTLTNGVAQAEVAIVCNRAIVSWQADGFDVPLLVAVDEAGRPLPTGTGQAAGESRLAVQVAAALQAETLSAAGLRSVNPNTLSNWLDAAQVRAVRFAYQHDGPTASLRLAIKPRPSKVRFELLGGLAIHPAVAQYSYRLRYTVEGSPIDQVAFELDEQFSRQAALSSNSIRGVRTTPAGPGKVRWTVSLVQEVTGVLDLVLNFAAPVDPDKAATLVVPRVATTAPDGYRAVVAVQNLSRHQVTVARRDGLSDMPVAEQAKMLNEQVSLSLQCAVQSFTDDWQMAVNIQPVRSAERPRAIVDLMAITTVLDREGNGRYQVDLMIQNRTEQFLPVDLPNGFRLWGAAVAGQPVRPVVGDSPTQVRIPLLRTSAVGLPYVVRLYLAGRACQPLHRLSRLSLPSVRVAGNIQVRRTTWSLRLPEGYHYVARGGNMSPLADKVEAMVMLIDAQMEQIARLNQIRGEVGSFGRQRDELERNWVAFNNEVAGNIRQLREYAAGNSVSLGEKTVSKLNKRLDDQSSSQYAVLGVWEEGKRREREMLASNLNGLINGGAINFGLSESVRDDALLVVPTFVQTATEGQRQQLQAELAEAQKKDKETVQHHVTKLPAKPADQVAVDVQTLLADADEKKAIAKVLEESSAKNSLEYMTLVQDQLATLRDNRLQRAYEKTGAGTLNLSADNDLGNNARLFGSTTTDSLTLNGNITGYSGTFAGQQAGMSLTPNANVTFGQSGHYVGSDGGWSNNSGQSQGTFTMSGTNAFTGGTNTYPGGPNAQLNVAGANTYSGTVTINNGSIVSSTLPARLAPNLGMVSNMDYGGALTINGGGVLLPQGSADPNAIGSAGRDRDVSADAVHDDFGVGQTAWQSKPQPGARAGRGRGDGRRSGLDAARDQFGQPGLRGGDATTANFSLPLQLPEGGLQLDFAHPSGEAELVLWAVEEETVNSTIGLFVVLAALVVLWVAIAVLRRLRRRRLA